jgi:hypothetical protein
MSIQIKGGKIFGYEHPSDLLKKLEWEYGNVMRASFLPGREYSYHFMNFCITAFHMADWIFPHLPADVRSQHKDEKQFWSWLKKQRRELAACRGIANTSKHFIANSDDERTTIEILSMPGWDEPGSAIPGRVGAALAIDGNVQGLDKFAHEILNFWTEFLAAHILMKD